MSKRDEDQTLIDIRFGHDVFDPWVDPTSFAPDLVNDHPHLNLAESEDAKAITMMIVCFVGVLFMYAIAALAWTSLQSPVYFPRDEWYTGLRR